MKAGWLAAVLMMAAVQAGEGSAVARAARAGWAAARALAAKGGDVAALGSVNEQLKVLAGLSGDREARYADVAIRAAVSAAQDERDEMAVFLTHARALDTELRLLGGPARWPVPIDELEGELWLEVDRYPEARAAYERATASTGTASSWLGLARVNDRLGRVADACRAYASALSAGLADRPLAEAARYVASPECRVAPVVPGSRPSSGLISRQP